ncbi:MAG TPA: dihydrolipoamide acetyltransferase family protein [Gemmatimonadaceae bacterium]|nr:dihydrolipoamide acetyltransferase family protein [Gemmatimonadaceae bacterium]
MATKVFMEALSPTMEEGRLVTWVKNEGDAVKTGDVLAEVETDKAIMELAARADGVLRKRLVSEGESRPVGQVVAVIAAADEDIGALLAEAGAGTSGGGSPAPATAAAPAPPQLKSPAPPAAAPAAPPAARAASPVPGPSVAAASTGRVAGAALSDGEGLRSSPLARRLAREQGLELRAMRGSGPGGRIIKRDIEAAMAEGGATSAAPGIAAAQAAPSMSRPAAPAREGDFQDIPLTQIRKTIARRLSESIGPIPTFYLTAEFDLSRVSELRAAMAELGDDFKVSLNDLLLKAVATALAQHPEVNAHWLGDRIRHHNRVHLGMAVATPDGLIVPVIFDADRKRLSEISREAKDLARRARERKLTPEEYTGSTCSVSNLGMFDIDQFTAIINPPEVAILAIGTASDEPVAAGDRVAVRRRVRVTMSCDHRVVDGAVGAQFLRTLRRMVENPLMLVY